MGLKNTRRIIAVMLLLLVGFSAKAQSFTNAWISSSQTYYKFKIWQDGVYRLSYQKLQNAGVPVSSINPKNFQLFHRGVQVPLIVKGEADNTFDPSDHITFYASSNDGKLDTALYQPISAMPHDQYSLYSDTSVYFLTWTPTTPGLRFVPFNGTNVTGTPESYFVQEVARYDTNSFYKGMPYSDQNYFSEYGEAEGWMGSRVQVTNNPAATPVRNDVSFNIPLLTPFKSTANPAARLEIQFYGQSNASTVGIASGKNHHVQVKIGTSILLDTMFLGYVRIAKTFYLNTIINNPTVTLTIVDDQNLAVDAIALSYVRLYYSRSFDFSDTLQRRFNFVGTGSASRIFFSPLKNVLNANPVLLDLTNRLVISGIKSAGGFEVMVPNAGSSKTLMLYDDSLLVRQVDSVYLVSFKNYLVGGPYDYILIYHPSTQQAAFQHAIYRNTASGGGYNVLLANINDLYDQFYYGQHHPFAIRNFADYLLRSQTTKPKYMLLVGKGYSCDLVRKHYFNAKLNNDLIPTIGNPASDNLLTAGLGGSIWEAGIATGRISARNNTEANNFLQKIRDFESVPPAIWQKNVVHISGAKSSGELSLITSYQNAFYDSIRSIPFGAANYKIEKNVTVPVSSKLKGDIISEVNSGVSLFSYFGHGSANTLAIDIGQPNEYSNRGKYPLMIFNGCSVGNAFDETSLGETFTNYPNSGAVGWIAHSNLGIIDYLGLLSEKIYGNFNKMYGDGVGQQLKAGQRQAIDVNNPYYHLHVTQQIYLGDPALKLFNAPKPDFVVSQSGMYLEPDPVNALTDSFRIAVKVENVGRAVDDSAFISIGRQVESGAIKYSPKFKVKVPLNTDTFYLSFRSPSLENQGKNNFYVYFDSTNLVDEMDNVTNNQAMFSYFMAGNGLNLSYPENFGIVGSDTVPLVVYFSNLKQQRSQIWIELDTTIHFNSPFLVQHRSNPSSNVVVFNTPILKKDSTVYYWRARLNVPDTAGGFWTYRSFTYLKNQSPGWSQSHLYQWRANEFQDLLFDSASRQFGFDSIGVEIKVLAERFATSGRGFYLSGKQPASSGGVNTSPCSGRNFIVEDFDQFTLAPSYYVACTGSSAQRAYMAFNMSLAADRAAFVNHMNNVIPAGNYVAISSYYPGATSRPFIQIRNWEPAVMQAIASIGCDTSQIRAINNDSTSIGIIGKLGWNYGTASFGSLIDTSIANAGADTLAVRRIINIPVSPGFTVSPLIGPVKRWESITWKWNSLTPISSPDGRTVDTAIVSLIGVRPDKTDTVLIADVSDSIQAISYIDPIQFPYLKLKFFTVNSTNFRASQLKIWSINYQPLPELGILAEPLYSFYKDSLPEGDTVRMKFAVINLGKTPIKNYEAAFMVTDAKNQTIKAAGISVDTLQQFERDTIQFKLPTYGYAGQNSVIVSVLSRSVNATEGNLVNNYTRERFFVVSDKKAPLVDVTFDGKHLFSKEIVSPSPRILISVTDENPYFNMKDTSVIRVYLLRPNKFYPDTLCFYNNSVLTLLSGKTDKQGLVLFNPQNLEDGSYTLMVEAYDMTGNKSSDVPFTVDFQIVTKSSISHFYPYPNPFSTSCKFVFTLTGSEIPDDISIRIYTPSGKLVREVSKAELGAIRIGNNVSDFSWNGTDQFGDQLANGVYFYRVVVKNKGKTVDLMQVENDIFFGKGTGKVYLMR